MVTNKGKELLEGNTVPFSLFYPEEGPSHLPEEGKGERLWQRGKVDWEETGD